MQPFSSKRRMPRWLCRVLDELPIRTSGRVLISMAAQSLPFAQSAKTMVMLSEPLVGSLSIRAKEGLRAFRLTADGAREPAHAEFADGTYTIKLDRSIGSYWVLLENPQR